MEKIDTRFDKAKQVYLVKGNVKMFPPTMYDENAIASLLVRFFQLDKANEERSVTAFLNRDDELIALAEISKGTKHNAPITVDAILTKCLLVSAEKIYLMHNHPNGTESSEIDRLFAIKLNIAAMVCNLELMDSIICTPQGVIHSIKKECPGLIGADKLDKLSMILAYSTMDDIPDKNVIAIFRAMLNKT